MVENSNTINFIISPFSVSFDLPCKIDKGFILRKAKPIGNEMGKILAYLKTINTFHGPTHDFSLYEEIEKGENVIAVAFDKEFMGSKETHPHIIGIESNFNWGASDVEWINFFDTKWEFWVIASSFDVAREDIENLCDAFTISDYGLIVGLRCDEDGSFDAKIKGNEPYRDYPLKLYYENGVLKFKDYQKQQVLTNEGIRQIKTTYRLLKVLDKKKYGFIQRAIEDYKNLLVIPRESSLLLVGLFSILELLLTHDDKNPNASRISWQLQKKIALLNNQFSERIDFAKHFSCSKDTKDETIVERLYQKRSLIAHGNQGDFSRDLQVISKGDEIAFLRFLIRKTISYALQNPQLVSDLREC